MPEQIFILIIGIAIIYLIYKAAYVVPNDIKRIESKVDNLQLHLKEIGLKLSQLDKKIDKK
jgi:cell division protein FtsL